MKSTLTTSFIIAAAAITLAAPSAHAATTTIHTDALTGSCHVGQTYHLFISHNAQTSTGLKFTDNGVQIPLVPNDHNLSAVDWTPTTPGQHTLQVSGDSTGSSALLPTLGSSALSQLTSGSGLTQSAPVSIKTTVVPASDNTTRCLQ